MVKIKRKVQKNLPQLIEWVIENKKFNTMFNSDKCNIVLVSDRGTIEFTGLFYDDTFTVEVEEVVDEDTKFRHIVFIDDCGLSASWGNSSINDIKYGKDKEFHAYIDGEFKLIWRNGKLVE